MASFDTIATGMALGLSIVDTIILWRVVRWAAVMSKTYEADHFDGTPDA
jgi:hypothetical protein